MTKKLMHRYSFFIIMLIIGMIITIINKQIGVKIWSSSVSSFFQMLGVLPPIMIMLGLMDVWVPRATLMKYMGEDSGILGVFLAILIASLAAGPMYAAFPFTQTLLRKGVKFSNVLIFMNAWCVTKIPTLLFEISSLGPKFTLVRFLINVPGIIIMGLMINYLLSKEDLDKIYKNAENQILK